MAHKEIDERRGGGLAGLWDFCRSCQLCFCRFLNDGRIPGRLLSDERVCELFVGETNANAASCDPMAFVCLTLGVRRDRLLCC